MGMGGLGHSAPFSRSVVMLASRQPPPWVTERSCQLLAELEAGTEQAHFGIGFAEPEGRGGFLDGKPFDIPQQEHQPVLFVQFGQRLIQQAPDFILVDQLLR
jgi:hypothetical protein